MKTALRVGTGFDVHRLVPNRTLMIGGVKIPFELGLLGHSDGDVLIHAIIDALLGACGLGDIGVFFPPDDPCLQGVDSAFMLEQVLIKLRREKYMIVNIDCVIVCEQPKLSPYYADIREKLCALLDIAKGLVNVKAKTAEQLGEIGKGVAIAAHAIALVERQVD